MKILMCLVFACCLLWAFISCNKIKNTYTVYLQQDPNYSEYLFIPVTINNNICSFLFDTGTSSTSIDSLLADKIGVNAVGYSFSPVSIGINNTKISDSIAYAKVEFVIGNLHFGGDISLSGQKLAKMLPNNATILGMNVIQEVNWLFNFSDSTVTISKGKIEIPAFPDDKIMTLNYYLGSDSITYMDITIDGQSFKNVLFDTGYRTALILSEKKRDIDIIFSESDYAAFTKKPIPAIGLDIDGISYIITDSIQINDFTMRSLIAMKAYKGTTKTVITANFVHRFRMMYIDSKNKKIQLYVSPSDSARYQRKDIQDFIKEMQPQIQGNDTIYGNSSNFKL